MCSGYKNIDERETVMNPKSEGKKSTTVGIVLRNGYEARRMYDGRRWTLTKLCEERDDDVM